MKKCIQSLRKLLTNADLEADQGRIMIYTIMSFCGDIHAWVNLVKEYIPEIKDLPYIQI
jgi:hypothetical protein